MADVTNSEACSLVDWLRTDDSPYWTEESRRVWERFADEEPATRIQRARATLAQSIENHVVDSAPEHKGDVYGHLLADAIERTDWSQVAGWLLAREIVGTLAEFAAVSRRD